MNKEIFRVAIGLSVIIVHFLCFMLIFFGKGTYLTPPQQISVALLFLPITAAYVVAVVKSAIDRGGETIIFERVNMNYALVVSSFTAITLFALLWVVFSLTGAQESDRQIILVFETAFGAGFGLIASDLFGKAEPAKSVETAE